MKVVVQVVSEDARLLAESKPIPFRSVVAVSPDQTHFEPRLPVRLKVIESGRMHYVEVRRKRSLVAMFTVPPMERHRVSPGEEIHYTRIPQKNGRPASPEKGKGHEH